MQDVSNILFAKVLQICRAKSSRPIEDWRTLEKEIKEHLKGNEIEVSKLYRHIKRVKKEVNVSIYQRDIVILEKRLRLEQEYTKLLKEKMAKAQMILRTRKC